METRNNDTFWGWTMEELIVLLCNLCNAFFIILCIIVLIHSKRFLEYLQARLKSISIFFQFFQLLLNTLTAPCKNLSGLNSGSMQVIVTWRPRWHYHWLFRHLICKIWMGSMSQVFTLGRRYHRYTDRMTTGHQHDYWEVWRVFGACKITSESQYSLSILNWQNWIDSSLETLSLWCLYPSENHISWMDIWLRQSAIQHKAHWMSCM